ncbi:hypothetical protein Pan216_14550 [Planctomycetes bacterium Pan216]|uniref:Uncharacterized protein n=1 Tax=Kolteria novifilia TaxID=2527975 RepID=A0A518B0U8_9BACT|nr:hypothetical protein Pan216_14550 [Planctomycetes bacterium Pan216]
MLHACVGIQGLTLAWASRVLPVGTEYHWLLASPCEGKRGIRRSRHVRRRTRACSGNRWNSGNDTSTPSHWLASQWRPESLDGRGTKQGRVLS